MLAIPDIVVSMSVAKTALSPTKLEFGKAKKTCDIISPSPQGLAGDICYLS